MKIKILSLWVFSAFILTACGGGSDSSPSFNSSSPESSNNTPQNGNKPADQVLTQIYMSEMSDDTTQKILGYDIDTITIKDGQYYTKNENNLGYNQEADMSFLVTADGVYEDGPKHPTYGVNIGSVTGSPANFTLKPYSKIASKGLTFNQSYKTIDLSNKSLSEVINPYNAWVIKNNLTSQFPISDTLSRFYNASAATKFPAGSQCFQLTKSENNQEHIELYNDTKNQKNVMDIWNQEANKIAADTQKKIFKDTTAFITSQHPQYDTYAKFQSDFYAGDYYSKGIDFLLSDEISNMKEDINQNSDLTAEEKANVLEYINITNNLCTVYNNTATETIRNAISNFK